MNGRNNKETEERGVAGERRAQGGATGNPTDKFKRPLATLAHELKTPISAIAAAADVMRLEQLGPIGNDKYRDYAGDIHASALHVLAVIDRMMAQRSGDEATAQPAPSEIDAHVLLSGICSALGPLAKASGVSLNLSASDRDRVRALRVVADEVSVRQIVLNLATNAIKFTPIGGCVELGAQVVEGGGLEISVNDSGCGMTGAQIEMALSGETITVDNIVPVGRGLGIGLPLVRALCEANGARLELSSEGPSKGTRAGVTFAAERVVAA